MPGDALPRVLVVGTLKAGKRTLINRLCSDTFEQPAQEEAIWNFSTKYYEATAKFVTHVVSGDRLDQTKQTEESEGPVEAVVLLHECTDHESFLAVKSWAESKGQEVSSGAAVCLSICNKVLGAGVWLWPQMSLLSHANISMCGFWF